MQRIRAFFYDEQTKAPIHGLKISGEITVEENGEDGREVELKKYPIGTLATSNNGYLSFYLDCCHWHKQIHKGILFIPGLRERAFDITKHLAKNERDEMSPIELTLEADLYLQFKPNYQLLSVQYPDKADFQFTQLANKFTQLSFGNGSCEKMVPQHVQKSCYELYHVVPDGTGKRKIEYLDGPGAILQVQEADLLRSEVCWEWLGYSLGKLVNSISLAPCETAQFSVKNWPVDSRTCSENNSTEEFRSSMIEESMQGTMKDFGFGLRINPYSLERPTIWDTLVGLVFKPQKGANDLLRIGTESQRKVVNQISRNVSRLTNVHQIAIQRSSTEGQSTSSQRSITNLNQCHSQTTNFFEVVDNYEVSSCIKERRKGLMIKYPNSDFTKQRIFCYRYLFQGNLLDPLLEDCLKGIGKVAACCEPEEDEVDCIRIKSMKVKFTIGKNETGSLIRLALRINGNVQYFFVPRGGDSKYKRGDSYEHTFTLEDGICVGDITAVGLQNDPDNLWDGGFDISSIGVQYTSPDFSGYKAFFSHGPHATVNRNETDWLGAPRPWMPAPEPPIADCSADETCCSEQLLNHFNCNKLFYNQIIWRFENPHQRLTRLNQYYFQGAPLSFSIINQPIAVWGEWVVFELADSPVTHLRPCISSEEIVSLPTAGLFSETLLGNCNSCEEPDDDLYKLRSEFPCGCGCRTNQND